MAEKRRSLAFSHRKLSREWHPTKNGELTPQQVSYGSKKKAWWKCSSGHEWQTRIKDRAVQGNACPYCSGRRATPQTSLKALHPHIARQWHSTKNKELKPTQLRSGSGKKVWWRCNKGHEWQDQIYSRTRYGGGCPYCSGKRVSATTSLKARYPRIARQWHPTKNEELKPQQVTPGSNKKVWWKCNKGHEWMATVGSRIILGSGCPCCSGRSATPQTSLKAQHPRIARQWHPTENGELKPQHLLPGSHKRVWWRCPAAHVYKMAIRERTTKGRGCPACAGL